MVQNNQVRCDEKILFDVFNVDGTTISVTLFANKKSIKRYLKDIYNEDDTSSLTFNEGINRLYEYHKGKHNPQWEPSWLAE